MSGRQILSVGADGVARIVNDHGPDGLTSCGGGCCDGWGHAGSRPGDKIACPCAENSRNRRAARCGGCDHGRHGVFGCKETVIREEDC